MGDFVNENRQGVLGKLKAYFPTVKFLRHKNLMLLMLHFGNVSL
jgi:hypothetical protein